MNLLIKVYCAPSNYSYFSSFVVPFVKVKADNKKLLTVLLTQLIFTKFSGIFRSSFQLPRSFCSSICKKMIHFFILLSIIDHSFCWRKNFQKILREIVEHHEKDYFTEILFYIKFTQKFEALLWILVLKMVSRKKKNKTPSFTKKYYDSFHVLRSFAKVSCHSSDFTWNPFWIV